MKPLHFTRTGGHAGALVALLLALALAPPAHARTRPDAVTARLVQRHAECPRPALHASAVAAESGPAYSIEVRGEPYRAAIEARADFALLPPRSDEPVAQAEIERPPPSGCGEQARWLGDVAERGGVEAVRRPLSEGASVLTVNKTMFTGRMVGISLLSDPRRRLLVQWDWPILSHRIDMDDAHDMQTAVGRRLMPCLPGG